MDTNPPEPKPRRKWHLAKWLVLLIVATFAYAAWRAYIFRSAIKQAEALGWQVVYTDPYAEIRKDWKAAFKKHTWLNGVTYVFTLPGENFAQTLDIVQRLNPKELEIHHGQALLDLSAFKGLTRLESLTIGFAFNLTNLDALKNHTSLKRLSIANARALTNVDGLQNLLALEKIFLGDCTSLTNVDALKNLPALRSIDLRDCTALKNTNALKNLATLETVLLMDCTGLTNVDALNSLPALNYLFIGGCTGLSKETTTALKAAFPRADIRAK